MRIILILILSGLSVKLMASPPSTGKVEILTMDFAERPGFELMSSGRIKIDGKSIAPRYEGSGAGANNFKIINDSSMKSGRALHCLCAAQVVGDKKARQEHYLHEAPMERLYCSEFSIKLDPDFTPVLEKRPDGGANWCILRQWHQTSPESPPLSLRIVPGTNNVIIWKLIYRVDRISGFKSKSMGRQTLNLGQWYHFRVLWRFSPGVDGRCEVMMSEKTEPMNLTSSNNRFLYKGPLGYSTDGLQLEENPSHDQNSVREQQGIYQGPHHAPDTHHGYSIGNVSIYREKAEGR